MANANITSTEHQPQRAQFLGELTIIMHRNWSIARYIGTRMQLEAEGIIPTGTEWPDGFGDVFWKVDGIRFWLRRERPEGAKGPRRAFFDCDYWCLRMVDRENVDFANEAIRQKAEELRRMVHSHTPEGRAESNKQWDLYCKAQRDEKFQAFKARIPGINQPKERARNNFPKLRSGMRRDGVIPFG